MVRGVHQKLARGERDSNEYKDLSIAFLVLTIGYSAAVVVPFVIGKVVLILIAVCVSIHILSFPTLEPDAGT